MILATTYNYFFVSLSVIIAIFGSYVALDLGVRAKFGWVWTVAAAMTLGLAIWSMHFTGMLAYNMGIPVTYDAKWTLASLAIAMIVTGVGFAVRDKIWLAGPLMGSGIAAMHYTGMAAMRMGAIAIYDPWIVAASVGVAIAASTASLWFYARQTLWPLMSATVMGLAIAGMHYTGMAAVCYTSTPNVRRGMIEPFDMAISIWIATMLVLAAPLAVSIWDRRKLLTDR